MNGQASAIGNTVYIKPGNLIQTGMTTSGEIWIAILGNPNAAQHIADAINGTRQPPVDGEGEERGTR